MDSIAAKTVRGSVFIKLIIIYTQRCASVKNVVVDWIRCELWLKQRLLVVLRLLVSQH